MRAALSRRLARWPTERALRAASMIGLVALGLMAAGILWPAPLMVVAGMSVAQLLGATAFALYVLSVAAEYRHFIGGTRPPDGGPEPK